MFNNPCDNPFSFSAAAQTNPDPDRYTGTPMTTIFNRFNINPDFCAIDYACKSVTPVPNTGNVNVKVPTCNEITFNLNFALNQDGTVSFTATPQDYIDSRYTPGTFQIEIEGTARRSGQTRIATIQMTLLDACNPPTRITAPTLIDQDYRLTDPNHPTYTAADFSVEPSFCPI